MRPLDHRAADNRAILQHILQIDQITVVHMLGKVVCIMEVNKAGFVGIHNLLGQQNTAGDILADLAGHIIALYAVDRGVLVRILLLNFLIIALNQAENLLVRRVGFTHQCTGIPVGDIAARQGIGIQLHQVVFHLVLDLLHAHRAFHRMAIFLHALRNLRDLLPVQPIIGINTFVRFLHSGFNFTPVKLHLRTVALDDFHVSFLPQYLSVCVSARHTNNQQRVLYHRRRAMSIC